MSLSKNKSRFQEVTIEQYSVENKVEWEEFVQSSNNGTMFHLQSFLDYHAPGKFEFTNYIIRHKEKIIAVLPGGYKENGTIYWSPIGASYGSFVTGDIPFELALKTVDAMLEFFRERNVKEIFLIPPPLIYNLTFNQHIEYAMLYRNFDFEYHYISHAIDLSHGANVYKNYQARARRKIKHSLKNPDIKIVENKDYEAFYPILVKNKLKHNAKPTHSFEDLIRLEQLIPERLKLFMAYYKDIPIGGHLLFLANKNVSLCFYNVIDYDYAFLDTGYILLNHVVDWSIANGYKWCDIGVSQDTASDNPMTPSLDLIYFKEKFGARGIFRSTFHRKL